VSEGIFGKPGQFSKFTSLAVVDGEKLIAGVLFHNWFPQYGIVEMTAAACDRRWLTRPVVKAILAECFIEKNCQTTFVRVADGAAHARIFRALGFKEMRLPNFRGKDKDELLLMLTDDQWKSSCWS
jgi:hypothetical protein